MQNPGKQGYKFNKRLQLHIEKNVKIRRNDIKNEAGMTGL